MKTIRMSRSAENRNARKAIVFRGGSRGPAQRLTQKQQVVSGRRLRRIARSDMSRLEAFVVPEAGSDLRPTFHIEVDPTGMVIRGPRLG